MSTLICRLGEILFILIAASFLIFITMGLMPGDPVDMLLASNPNATAQDAARLKALYGLDQPLMDRYVAWLQRFIQGDLGISRLYSLPVTDVLMPALRQTLLLISLSLGLGLCLAFPLGIWSAFRAGKGTDIIIRGFAFLGQSIPPFWMALMLILIFAATLEWLPAGGNDTLLHLILPVLSLSLAFVASYTRHIRSAVLEVMHKQHVLTAKAKGVGNVRLLAHHIMPGTLVPIITLLALDLGIIVSGAVITETVFNLRGMGRLIYDAIMGNDYNLALSALMLVTFCVVMANRLADCIYPLIDPRQRDTGGS